MRKLLAHTLTLMLLLVGLIACQHIPPTAQVRSAGADAIFGTVPASTIPPGVNGNDIRGTDPETMEAVRQIVREQPGLAFGIRGTYAEQVPGTYDAFRVEEGAPFVGQLNLWNAQPEAHEYAITCLIDHVQTPCTPNESLVQFIALEADEEILLPLEISNLTHGLHDFSVTFWQDPYADSGDPEADGRVFNSDTYRARVSLFVGDDTTPPSIALDEPDGQPAHNAGWIYVNQERDPRDEYGGFPVITHLATSAGEPFDLYIHLNNKENTGTDFALTAFVDYQQVPIYRNGELHTPLYIHIPPSTWQPIAVQFKAPDTPGFYEFIVVGTLFPFARLDTETEEYYGIDALLNNAYSSARILLEVK